MFVVESPLSEIVDEPIWLLSNPKFKNDVVINEKHQAFFAAVKMSHCDALAKLEKIKFVAIHDDEDSDAF